MSHLRTASGDGYSTPATVQDHTYPRNSGAAQPLLNRLPNTEKSLAIPVPLASGLQMQTSSSSMIGRDSPSIAEASEIRRQPSPGTSETGHLSQNKEYPNLPEPVDERLGENRPILAPSPEMDNGGFQPYSENITGSGELSSQTGRSSSATRFNRVSLRDDGPVATDQGAIRSVQRSRRSSQNARQSRASFSAGEEQKRPTIPPLPPGAR